MTQPVIMWFRQDLRLADHPALTAAAAAGPVIPVFILDDETPKDWRWGGASRWWLHKSLVALNTKLPLVLRRGEAVSVLERLIAETGAASIYFTRDYAPWSGALERRVKVMCDRRGVDCHRHGGFLLHEPESIRNGSGGFFKVYTPFSRVCFAKGHPRPLKPVPKVELHPHDVASDDLTSWDLLPSRPNWATGFEAAWQPGEGGVRGRCWRVFWMRASKAMPRGGIGPTRNIPRGFRPICIGARFHHTRFGMPRQRRLPHRVACSIMTARNF